MEQGRAGRSTFSCCPAPSDILAVKVGLAVVILAGAAVVAVPAWNLRAAPVTRAGDILNVLFCGPIGLTLIGVCLYGWRGGGPRTWEWDADGIEFRGPRGRRHLRWDDVEHVHWDRHGATLAGRGGRIHVNWSAIAADRRVEAHEGLLRILRADFDLPGPPAEGEKPRFPWVDLAEYLAGMIWLSLSSSIAIYAAYRIARAFAPWARTIFRDKEWASVVLTCTTLLAFGLIWLGLTLPLLIRARGFGWYDRRLAYVRDRRDPL